MNDKLKSIFKDPKDAPKDRVFLAFFKNWPFCTTCHWSKSSKKWVAANLQYDLWDGKFDDAYFENEYFNIENMIKWCELPEDK